MKKKNIYFKIFIIILKLYFHAKISEEYISVKPNDWFGFTKSLTSDPISLIVLNQGVYWVEVRGGGVSSLNKSPFLMQPNCTITQGCNARKVNCGRVYSAYILKPVLSGWNL